MKRHYAPHGQPICGGGAAPLLKGADITDDLTEATCARCCKAFSERRPFDPKPKADPTPGLTAAVEHIGDMVMDYGDDRGWADPLYLDMVEVFERLRDAYNTGRL